MFIKKTIKESIQNFKITDARDSYKEKLTVLNSYRDEEGIISSVTVNLRFDDLEKNSYYVNDSIKIKVYVSDEVERISARQKCILLHSYLVDLENIIENAKKESGYKETIEDEMSKQFSLKYYGKYMSFRNEYDIDFISSNYEYSFWPIHFYITKSGMWGSDEYKYKFQDNELILFQNTEDVKKKNAPEIPYVGMSEDQIGYTRWGRADKIEKSVDFDKVNYHHKSKTYKWYDIDDKTWLAVVTVLYDENGHGSVNSVDTFTK